MFALLFALPLLASAAVHDVQVGKDGFAFTPEALSANVGDQVVFHFVAKNHTATQSSFANPCGPMDGGFDSGFMPVAPNATDIPTFSYTVTGTDPVWVYCKQASGTPASHCGAGMVFSINCPTNSDAKNSFNNFKASALAIGQQLQAQATSASADSGYGGSSAGTSAASAPETSATSSTPVTTSSTGTGQVHEVVVGGNGTLTFEPSHITAAQNDVISFKFVSKNHTATQSTFASPCRKVESTSTTQQVGFDSGFMFVGNSTTPLVWNVTVNDTTPIWVYCRQATPLDHCGAGMVFAVNSDEGSSSQKTFSIFQAAAKAQNGTSQNGTTTTTGTTGTSGGAMPNRVGAALATIVVGVIGGLLL